MIGYLKGNILNLSPEFALIEVGGVGYEVQITGSAFSSIAGKSVGEVYTYLQVKEDGISLYGFSSLQEKEMFLKLISVSGVGPKMGIAVLSGLDANAVAVAIATANIKALSAVKGLGKKTAERIILELREKVSAQTVSVDTPVLTPVLPVEEGDEDAITALITLGFKREESQKAVQKAKQQGAKTIEDIIMLALKGM